jgi:uncharacterized protein (TIGR00730 family)
MLEALVQLENEGKAACSPGRGKSNQAGEDKLMQSVCVFCGSSNGVRAAYVQAAQELGALLARRGIRLVYGGGNVGLMGVLANAALDLGGQVTGVLPEALAIKEVLHPTLTDQRVVTSMHERKAMMADLSDAFVAMPGGFGTMEEFFEVLTWAQLGFHHKPLALLNVEGFFDPLLRLFEHMVEEGFVRAQHREIIVIEATAAALLDTLAVYEAPMVNKWLDREDL